MSSNNLCMYLDGVFLALLTGTSCLLYFLLVSIGYFSVFCLWWPVFLPVRQKCSFASVLATP